MNIALDCIDAPSYWRASVNEADLAYAPLDGDLSCEVAVIGGGYTGLAAALHFARDHQVDVVVLEARQPGWGASGRNGGFCCMGSTKLTYGQIIRRYGIEVARHFLATQIESVGLVRDLAAAEDINVEAVGDGEMILAHRPTAARELQAEQVFLRDTLGFATTYYPRAALVERGMASGGFYGGLHNPVGFGLHPYRYARGLARAAVRRGARLFGSTPVTAWCQDGTRQQLTTPRGVVSAATVILATNGYTPEHMAPGTFGRTMPVQSNIIATRPLSSAEIAAQGWTALTLAADSRRLLHYFRLLADGTFIFGGRGGLRDTTADAATMQARLQREFRALFPAWADVEIRYFWRGQLCMARDRLPHIGYLNDDPRILAGLAYHGNGVAMATWTGRALADLAAGTKSLAERVPALLRRPLPRFPVPALRPLYFKTAYAGYYLADARP